MTSNSWYD